MTLADIKSVLSTADFKEYEIETFKMNGAGSIKSIPRPESLENC